MSKYKVAAYGFIFLSLASLLIQNYHFNQHIKQTNQLISDINSEIEGITKEFNKLPALAMPGNLGHQESTRGQPGVAYLSHQELNSILAKQYQFIQAELHQFKNTIIEELKPPTPRQAQAVTKATSEAQVQQSQQAYEELSDILDGISDSGSLASNQLEQIHQLKIQLTSDQAIAYQQAVIQLINSQRLSGVDALRLL